MADLGRTPSANFSEFYVFSSENSMVKQECIPVGCVLAARRPYAGVCFLGGCLLRGGVWSGGVSAPGGCLVQGGVCSWGGVCSQGCLVWGGGCLLQGESALGGIPACTEADPSPPVNRMNDRQV